MKKILLSAVLVGLLVSPALILAVESTVGQTVPIAVVTSGAGLKDLIIRIGDWVFIFLIAVASVLLIVAGFLFITAAGDAEKLKKAKEMLVNSLVGVVIALLARGMVQVLQSIIGTGTGQ